VATEAARLKGKTSYREEKEKPTEKEKTDLTLTGLLMEGLGHDDRMGITPHSRSDAEASLLT
jgi:hypothetical protein